MATLEEEAQDAVIDLDDPYCLCGFAALLDGLRIVNEKDPHLKAEKLPGLEDALAHFVARKRDRLLQANFPEWTPANTVMRRVIDPDWLDSDSFPARPQVKAAPALPKSTPAPARKRAITPQEKRREERRRYYLKHKEKVDARNKAYYRANRATAITRAKAWKEAHPQQIKKNRKRRYIMQQAEAILYSHDYYYAHHAECLAKNAKRREANRPKHRAYCRDKSKRMTDGYIREQLSKYHPTKSCWEWTPEEVEAKRKIMMERRGRKLTDDQVLIIVKRFSSGETVHQVAPDYSCSKSTIWNIWWGKYRARKKVS
jgi:hypothetical protein